MFNARFAMTTASVSWDAAWMTGWPSGRQARMRLPNPLDRNLFSSSALSENRRQRTGFQIYSVVFRKKSAFVTAGTSRPLTAMHFTLDTAGGSACE
jgi:hypothetical protein